MRIVKFSPNQGLPLGYVVVFDNGYHWIDQIADIKSAAFKDRFLARKSAWSHYNSQKTAKGFFTWEQFLVGKNKHSVFTKCKECGSMGVNMPMVPYCGNCGSSNTFRYYDAETIHEALVNIK